MRPPALDELGLTGALRETITAVEDGAGPTFELQVPDQALELPAAVEVAAYHITMEAITNVLRHSWATRCRISLRIDDGGLMARIEDDGRGMAGNHHAGVGLSAMRERANELGGWCEVTDLAPGTCVQAFLPARR